MIEQRGTRCRPITEMHVDSLKGLKKRGTRGEGRQGKIGYEIIRSRDHGKLGMGILPQYLSLKVGAYGNSYEFSVVWFICLFNDASISKIWI